MNKYLKYILGQVISLFFPFGVASGQTQGTTPNVALPPLTPGPITSPGNIIKLINMVLYWVATAFWIAAAGFIFYAAYLYLTASGDEERVKKAHKQFLWAIVAIAVGLMAYGLPLLILNFLVQGGGLGICIFGICF